VKVSFQACKFKLDLVLLGYIAHCNTKL